MSDTPPWDESIDAFLRFLSEQGFSRDLVWVFREDVTNCRRRYWVRVPVLASNATRARQ